MPLYTYECDWCGRHTEQHQKYEERHNPVTCGTCGKPANYVVSAPAWISIGPGRSEASKREYATRQRKILEKRAADHDRSPAGQEQRAQALAKRFGSVS